LAQLIGGFTAGVFLGRESRADSVVSALVFLAMIVFALLKRRRERPAFRRGEKP
jgi:hypothetical protein